uniref:PH domain-containing protein n=1 Tax=Meloidogyne hapla TaxID=6305 RepID=A0A1I8B748_MELHA
MEECSTSFLNNNKTKAGIIRFNLDLKEADNSQLIFCSVPVRTLLFFTNYFERVEYEKRKKWIQKIHERFDVAADQVKAALRVSIRQLQIAQTLGDPISIARCYLYISLGLAQNGHFKKAISTVRGIWKENVDFLHSEFLKNCTLGVWMTIKWIKLKRVDKNI